MEGRGEDRRLQVSSTRCMQHNKGTQGEDNVATCVTTSWQWHNVCKYMHTQKLVHAIANTLGCYLQHSKVLALGMGGISPSFLLHGSQHPSPSLTNS